MYACLRQKLQPMQSTKLSGVQNANFFGLKKEMN